MTTYTPRVVVRGNDGRKFSSPTKNKDSGLSDFQEALELANTEARSWMDRVLWVGFLTFSAENGQRVYLPREGIASIEAKVVPSSPEE